MRLTSDMWVSAYIRQQGIAGNHPFLRKRGASEAGTIFIVCEASGSVCTLYGPAPQLSYAVEETDRLFSIIIDKADRLQIAERLEQEQKFDPDCWVVEIEISDAENHGLSLSDE